MFHRLADRCTQTPLVFGRDPGGKLRGRQQERIRRDHAPALRRYFFDEKAHRHEIVAHSGAQHLFGLRENPRYLVQSGDVIFVMPHRVERHGERQVGQTDLRAVQLADRHFLFLEGVVLDALRERTAQHFVRQRVLLGKAFGADRRQARQELPVSQVISLERLE